MRRRSLNINYTSIKKTPIELSKQNEIKTQFLKFNSKTIHNIIMNNLKKHKSNVNDLFIGFTNSIINNNLKSSYHLKYVEILYKVDGNEFLKDYYNIKESIEKIEKQTTIFNFIYKIFPNYYSLDEELTEIMMNNLLLKQKIIDKNIENENEKKKLEIFPKLKIDLTNFFSFSLSSFEEDKIEFETTNVNSIFQKSNKEKIINDSLHSIEVLITYIDICEKNDLNDSLELNRKSSRRQSRKKVTRRKQSLLDDRKISSYNLIGDEVILEEDYHVTSGFNKVLILSPLKKNILKKNIIKNNNNNIFNNDDNNIEFKKFTRIKDFKKKLNQNKSHNNTEDLVEAYYKFKVSENSINSTNYTYTPMLSLPKIKSLSNQVSNNGSFIKNKLYKRKKEKNKDILLTKINNETFKLISNDINNKKGHYRIFNFNKNNNNRKSIKKKLFSIPCLLVE